MSHRGFSNMLKIHKVEPLSLVASLVSVSLLFFNFAVYQMSDTTPQELSSQLEKEINNRVNIKSGSEKPQRTVQANKERANNQTSFLNAKMLSKC